MKELLEPSGYYTLVVTVPESHADVVRQAMGERGAGESEHYAFASFSVKGVSRFLPKASATPFLGKPGVLETLIEERIETICKQDKLEEVVTAIKAIHPYEETVIDIFPVYQIGYKRKS